MQPLVNMEKILFDWLAPKEEPQISPNLQRPQTLLRRVLAQLQLPDNYCLLPLKSVSQCPQEMEANCLTRSAIFTWQAYFACASEA